MNANTVPITAASSAGSNCSNCVFTVGSFYSDHCLRLAVAVDNKPFSKYQYKLNKNIKKYYKKKTKKKLQKVKKNDFYYF